MRRGVNGTVKWVMFAQCWWNLSSLSKEHQELIDCQNTSMEYRVSIYIRYPKDTGNKLILCIPWVEGVEVFKIPCTVHKSRNKIDSLYSSSKLNQTALSLTEAYITLSTKTLNWGTETKCFLYLTCDFFHLKSFCSVPGLRHGKKWKRGRASNSRLWLHLQGNRGVYF